MYRTKSVALNKNKGREERCGSRLLEVHDFWQPIYFARDNIEILWTKEFYAAAIFHTADFFGMFLMYRPFNWVYGQTRNTMNEKHFIFLGH